MRGSKQAMVSLDHQRAVKWLGNRLRQLRTATGFSQGELATMVGLSWQQIGKYEAGQNAPAITRLIQICTALDFRFEVLASELKDFSRVSTTDIE